MLHPGDEPPPQLGLKPSSLTFATTPPRRIWRLYLNGLSRPIRPIQHDQILPQADPRYDDER